MHTISRLRPLLDSAADLLLGAACPGCRSPGLGLCLACVGLLDGRPFTVDRGLGVPIAAANPYRPILEHVIPAYKDDGALYLDRFLGARLGLAVSALSPPPESLLVPVASLPSAVRRRGYDHARRLAAVAARRLSLRSRPWLVRGRSGGDQAALGRGARRRNVVATMRARGGRGQVVVLVDDVVTTGASLAEAMRALEEAGARIWGAAVIADVDDVPVNLRKCGPDNHNADRFPLSDGYKR